jgi:hypothetical protein
VGKIRAMSLFYKSIDNQLNKINKEYMTGSLEKEALYRYFLLHCRVSEPVLAIEFLVRIPPASLKAVSTQQSNGLQILDF